MSRILLLALTGLAHAQVTFPDLVKADGQPQNWLMYSGNYSAHRHSLLDQITPANAARLQLEWVYQARIMEKFEATPLVVEGVMYITLPPNDVVALDAETGVRLWEYKRKLPPKVQVCCGQVNRGLAVLGERLFMGTPSRSTARRAACCGTWKWRITNWAIRPRTRLWW